MLLLYSGGLDTSVMLHWIQANYEAEVVTLTVDLGQPGEDWDAVVAKAKSSARWTRSSPTPREEFAREYVLPAIKANALYGGGYPLFTALARPLIAKLAVEHAQVTGCDTIAHGCTGKGNDQVRIEATVATLDPDLRIIAPVRDWTMGREEELAYAREHGIPLKGGTEVSPYSIDDNLWGRSSEGREIEDLEAPPPDDVFQLVTPPERAPDEAQDVEVGFEAGIPVSLDGERVEPVELIERAAEIGARHGAGIIDHVEDRIVGLKVRDLYEVPAAAILMTAHAELEKLVSTIHQNEFKHTLDRKWAYLATPGSGSSRSEPTSTPTWTRPTNGSRASVTIQPVQGQRDAGGPDLAIRPVRPHAGRLLRERRPVLAGGKPRLHRAVHAPEPAGPPRASARSGRVG